MKFYTSEFVLSMIASSVHMVLPRGSHHVAKTRGFMNKKQVQFPRKVQHSKYGHNYKAQKYPDHRIHKVLITFKAN